MIALVAASSGGGGEPTRYTVPWCETVARKRPPEMPGYMVWSMFRIAALFRASGYPFERVWGRRGGGYRDALSLGVSLADVLIFEASLQLIRELGILGEVGP